MASISSTPTNPTTDQLERELAALEQRLRDGERRIEEANTTGADVAAWEEFWIELLHTYEAIYRRMNAPMTADDAIAA